MVLAFFFFFFRSTCDGGSCFFGDDDRGSALTRRQSCDVGENFRDPNVFTIVMELEPGEITLCCPASGNTLAEDEAISRCTSTQLLTPTPTNIETPVSDTKLSLELYLSLMVIFLSALIGAVVLLWFKKRELVDLQPVSSVNFAE